MDLKFWKSASENVLINYEHRYELFRIKNQAQVL